MRNPYGARPYKLRTTARQECYAACASQFERNDAGITFPPQLTSGPASAAEGQNQFITAECESDSQDMVTSSAEMVTSSEQESSYEESDCDNSESGVSQAHSDGPALSAQTPATSAEAPAASDGKPAAADAAAGDGGDAAGSSLPLAPLRGQGPTAPAAAPAASAGRVASAPASARRSPPLGGAGNDGAAKRPLRLPPLSTSGMGGRGTSALLLTSVIPSPLSNVSWPEGPEVSISVRMMNAYIDMDTVKGMDMVSKRVQRIQAHTNALHSLLYQAPVYDTRLHGQGPEER